MGAAFGGTTRSGVFSLGDRTRSNKVYAPALSQDLTFVRHDDGSYEVMVSFEGGSKKYRSMIMDLGWSVVEGNAYSFRLPIHRSTSAPALKKSVAIGFSQANSVQCRNIDASPW